MLMYAVAASAGFALPPAAAVLGFAGTLVVYGIDRLRDVERDRETTPARTAFVQRHRPRLTALCVLAVAVSAVAALRLPPATWWVCGLALIPGLLHRRIKHVPILKTGYVTFAWLAVCVGVPAAAGDITPADVLPAAVVLGFAIAGNLVASNLRDHESGAGRVSPRAALGGAVALCAAGLLVALVAGAARTIWPVALCQLVAVAGLATAPRDRERYGLVVVDGALWLGAALALWK